MTPRVFVGFGFGPIQAGLFLYEAWRSGRFAQLVAAEVRPDLVAAVRAAGGRYGLNVAPRDGIRRFTVEGVELLDPGDAADRARLIDAVAHATEIATALPSPEAYGRGEPHDVAVILAAGLRRKAADLRLPPAAIYTAENDPRAAGILAERIAAAGAQAHPARFDCLNTVIGKMSGVVDDPDRIAAAELAEIAPGIGRAFVVEAFNRILIDRPRRPDLDRGLTMFQEKDDLRPFAEAKLYGHNAIHALLGYLLHERGAVRIDEAARLPDVLDLVRAAFLEESGAALCRKHAGRDPLFAPANFRAHAEDLLERMLNPHLGDTVARVIRDPRRKLAWDDRLAGAMRLCLAHGIAPRRLARGVAAAVRHVASAEGSAPAATLESLWPDAARDPLRPALTDLVRDALGSGPATT